MAGNKTFTLDGTEHTMVVGAYPSNKLALCVYLNDVDTGDISAVLSVNLGVATRCGSATSLPMATVSMGLSRTASEPMAANCSASDGESVTSNPTHAGGTQT